MSLVTGAVTLASPSGAEGAVATYLVDALQGFCDTATVDAVGNAVGVWGRGDLHVWLLGHIDTVQGHIDVRVTDGVLHGRGAVDAKGSFCAFVAAAERLPPVLADRLTITLIGAVGEEAPHSVGARHAVATIARPDLVVIGEPSGWDGLTLGYKGTLQVELMAREPSRHSSVDAPTAAERVVECYNAVRRFVGGPEDPGTGEPTPTLFDRLQLRLLDLSASDDGLDQVARARLGFRLPPACDVGSLSERIEALAAAAGVEGRALTGAVAAYRAEKDGPLPASFRAAIRAVGGTPRHKLKTGTSDMNVVASAWHARGDEVPPMLAYGPGDANLDHTPEERLDLDEYRAAVAVLGRALHALAG